MDVEVMRELGFIGGAIGAASAKLDLLRSGKMGIETTDEKNNYLDNLRVVVDGLGSLANREWNGNRAINLVILGIKAIEQDGVRSKLGWENLLELNWGHELYRDLSKLCVISGQVTNLPVYQQMSSIALSLAAWSENEITKLTANFELSLQVNKSFDEILFNYHQLKPVINQPFNGERIATTANWLMLQSIKHGRDDGFVEGMGDWLTATSKKPSLAMIGPRQWLKAATLKSRMEHWQGSVSQESINNLDVVYGDLLISAFGKL